MNKIGVVDAIPPRRGGPKKRPRPAVRKPTSEERLAKRFWAKVNKNGPIPKGRPELGPCWVWTAHQHKQGYGVIAINQIPMLAHRVVYEMEVGPIPEGRIIDHICRNEPCVRPSHLRPVTREQNGENQGRLRNTPSGIRGVTFHKRSQKWQALCASRGKVHYAGLHDTIEQAAEAVRLKRLEVHTHNDTDRH
jgi:hypothetical protein